MIGMSMEGRGSVKSESCQLIVCVSCGDTSRVRPPGRRGIAARRRIRYRV